jgi:hypothetical protein
MINFLLFIFGRYAGRLALINFLAADHEGVMQSFEPCENYIGKAVLWGACAAICFYFAFKLK